MPTTTTKYTFSVPNSKHDAAKRWIQRHLRKPASRQTLKTGKDNNNNTRRPGSLKRPRTAPSTGAVSDASAAPTMPSLPINIQYTRKSTQPLLRPDSTVMRDVNAWLDASMSTPSPPLMGGLPYWRKATVPGVKDSAGAQHAIPIVREPEADITLTSHTQQAMSFCRRAKKKHVQLPSLLRTRSQRPAGRKQINRRSASMPLLAISYEDVRQAAPPMLLTRSRSFLRSATRPSTAIASTRGNVLPSTSQQSFEHFPLRHGTPASTRLGDTESNLERRMNAMLVRTARGADSTRLSTAAPGFSREDSMGDLSDAPTYFSGPPPPSYRSRAASILTTSSFGCIDGMTPAQRQISQQQAALRRGMRGKLWKFAQNFAT